MSETVAEAQANALQQRQMMRDWIIMYEELEKAAYTFEDFVTCLRILRHYVSADAAGLAARRIRETLAQVNPRKPIQKGNGL